MIFLCRVFCSSVEDVKEAAGQRLRTTFSNITNVDNFGESSIPGIYEMTLSGKVIYYYPEKDLLIFGEIINKEGVSLTGASLQKKATREKLKDFDYSKGLVMGDEEGVPVVEILNPDCFYCKMFDDEARRKLTFLSFGKNSKLTLLKFLRSR